MEEVRRHDAGNSYGSSDDNDVVGFVDLLMDLFDGKVDDKVDNKVDDRVGDMVD